MCVGGVETDALVELAGRRSAMAVEVCIDAAVAEFEHHNALEKVGSRKIVVVVAVAVALAGPVATGVAVAPTGVVMGHGSSRQTLLPVLVTVVADSNSHWDQWL